MKSIVFILRYLGIDRIFGGFAIGDLIVQGIHDVDRAAERRWAEARNSVSTSASSSVFRSLGKLCSLSRAVRYASIRVASRCCWAAVKKVLGWKLGVSRNMLNPIGPRDLAIASRASPSVYPIDSLSPERA
jgi:hypothetical protein